MFVFEAGIFINVVLGVKGYYDISRFLKKNNSVAMYKFWFSSDFSEVFTIFGLKYLEVDLHQLYVWWVVYI